MFDFDIDSTTKNPDFDLVLDAYAASLTQKRESGPDAQNWAPRVDAIEGVDRERLSQIHGQLIALGLLNHRIADRGRGVEYQLTSQGRQSLANHTPKPNTSTLTDADVEPSKSNEVQRKS